ncbi:MAG TPA: AbgT family transporter, partial [Thermomicrobiales bacterium]|nr:AbgT family transporter [Thermomicrobiales bacterium]
MSAAGAAAQKPEAQKRGFTEKMLDGIEKAGNKVPHPVMMFVYLIVLVIILSAILNMMNVGIVEEIMVPVGTNVTEEYNILGGTTENILDVTDSAILNPDFEIITERVEVKSLLSISGLRFLLTSFVGNFASFSVVAVIFVAMIGVGVAEEAGLMAASIRKLVAVAPSGALTFIIVLIGGLSSVATDAGYLILVPLGAAAFLSVKRHPLAGVAAAYAGVSAAFAVNILIAPLDAMLTEMTNEAIQITDPTGSITITANFIFSAVFTILMALVITFVTTRLIEPRLGIYDPSEAGDEVPAEEVAIDHAAESRGLKYSVYGILAGVVFFAVMTAPPGAPLRDPVDGSIIGNTPFMDSLVFMITVIFMLAGLGYGIGAKTFTKSTDVINAIVKTFASLSGLIFMLLIISQFIAYFNFTNIPRVLAGAMAHLLESANVGALPLLIGFILVIMLLDIIIPGAMPKWAIFAPVFVPIFMRLGVAPQTVLAAYRIGDSPMNVVTPLMVYLPFIVIVSQRYVKSAGLGTIISL